MRLGFTRRGFCMGAAALGATGGTAAKAPVRRFFERTGLPIGIQLYTLGDAVKDDIAVTFAALSAMGYKTVELAGYAGQAPSDFRAALDRAGLRCTSSHVGPDGLKGDLGHLSEEARILGFDTVIMPMFAMPARIDQRPRVGEDGDAAVVRAAAQMTAADWRANAAFLNDTAHKLQALGLRFGYHNHNLEFRPCEGSTGFEIMLRETDPQLVTFEMDVGWVAAAGLDPLRLLARHPGRFTAMHVKDIKASTRPNVALRQDPVEVGSGVIDWKRILPAAYSAGVRKFFVEQEAPFSRPRIEAARISFDYLDRIVA